MLDNWTFNSKKEVMSLSDKIKILLRPKNVIKLVYVQRCELEMLHKNDKKHEFQEYINYLYNHYIVHKLPKTYLC
jgi:hypothetical protein